MRDQVLLRSVRKCLGVEVHVAVFMWRTGSFTAPFATAAALGCALLAALVGFEWPTGVVAIGLVGGAVAWSAGTEYRVLAEGPDGELRLLRGSRIRQTAIAVLDDSIDRDSVRPVTVNAITTQWRVGRHDYTMRRRHQAPLTALTSADGETAR